MRLRPTILASLAVFALLGFAPSAAQADVSVMVLGIRSVEGDDDFARTLTDALRHQASQQRGWAVSDRDVSLSQMTLAFGCDEPDAACLAQIAEQLGVERILYGTVRRSSAGANYSYAIQLFAFNAVSGEIEESIADAVQRALADVDNLRPKVREWITALAGMPQVGRLVVRSSAPDAQVLLDGEVSGAVTEGVYTREELPPGVYLLEVAADGFMTFRQRITIAVGETAEVEATLEQGAEPNPPAALGPARSGGGITVSPELLVGIGLEAVGVGLLIGGFYSMGRIDSLNGNPDWNAYRARVPAGLDSCEQANMGQTFAPMGSPEFAAFNTTVKNVCPEAGTLEVLQFVLVGLGAAAIGVGTYFILTDLTRPAATNDGAPPPPTARLELLPSLGPQSGSLTLRLTM